MPVFRQREILLMQTRERAAALTGHHHVDNDNPRIGVEDLVCVVALGCGLALQGCRKEAAQAG